jgi:ubiquinone/menaquinone biosynthesis C-methylase UbiE
LTSSTRFLSERDWEGYFRDYWTLDELSTYKSLRASLIARAGIGPGMQVLDVGCGPGLYAPSITTLGASYTGIDASGIALAEARRRCPESDSLRFLRLDLREGLAFADGSFDRAVCNNVLYILKAEDRQRVLNEVARVLVPGGVAAFSEPGAGFKPMSVFLAGLREEVATRGNLHVIRKLVRLARPTLAILKMNARIKREAEAGEYHFLSEGELTELLQHSGLRISEHSRAYANQNVCVIGVKPQAQCKG